MHNELEQPTTAETTMQFITPQFFSRTGATLSTCALFLLTWSDACAEPQSEPDRPAHQKRQENFKKLDTDGNGALSLQEFSQSPRLSRLSEEKQKKLFAFLDKNKDGKLQKQELYSPRDTNPWMGRLKREFSQHDSDSDGNLSPTEFAKALKGILPAESRIKPEHLFRRLDRNKDHLLQKSELRSGLPLRPTPRGLPPMDFKKYDTDKSGGLTRKEFDTLPFVSRLPEERRQSLFKRLDANGDGEISRREVRREHQKRKSRDRPPHAGKPHDRPPGGDRPPRDAPRKPAGL